MKKSLIITTLVIWALIGASALSVLASGTWTGPTVLPPAGNVAAPLNIGALLQEKAGSLLLDGGLGVLGKSILTGGVSIGTTSDPIGWSALDVNGDVSIRGSQAKEAVLTSEAGNKGMEIKARGGEHPDLFVSTSGNIGIGTATPTANLDVEGTVKFGAAGTPGTGKVLTSDATGNATWQTSSSGGASIDYGDCTIIQHTESGACGVAAWGMCPNNYVMVGATTGLRYPNQCLPAQVKCCRLH